MLMLKNFLCLLLNGTPDVCERLDVALEPESNPLSASYRGVDFIPGRLKRGSVC